MYTAKTLQELTIKDNFMFGAVMSIPENCVGFLELVLGFPIERLTISREKSMIYHPEYKGIRLDIYARDAHHTHYNVEMQVVKKPALGKRSRYYHSQLDMEILASGQEYEALPNVFVIFICDFDPFGKELYCYTFEHQCLEDGSLLLEDGCKTIFLSTKGKNNSGVQENLVKFLNFVAADLEESSSDFNDPFVKQIQNSVQKIKEDREMGERFMILHEMMRDERNEGRMEGALLAQQNAILELLEELGSIPADITREVRALQSPEKLSRLHKKAARASSFEAFRTELTFILSEKL